MAEGADGEEEIQFLRTVSDAVLLLSTISKVIQSQCTVNRFLCMELSQADNSKSCFLLGL